ncbi:carboxypeptidase-like regulatory domain-containing protein [uncultured Parabacteroides sp.]|uniref:TonB-dependent receptor n=1 Tax=uncultured Parabacteroides sp. TaxID=512312 RepID=UPI002620B5D1|nr:carboxypeptidase-like regulatory domain-containing protein [uncultured Parabacteroides sp.]
MRRVFVIFLPLLFFLPELSALAGKTFVEGIVRDPDNEPLGFATVIVKELNISMLSDIDGGFKFPANQGETYTITVSCLNHVEKQVSVTAGEGGRIDITLERQSYALEEVVVMAEYKSSKGTSAVVSQQALEHIQPTSVADVLTLIPGGLYQESSATGFNRISLRQSGADDNTSLGMAIVMDGIAQDNDGFRSQIAGMSSADEYSDRIGLNKGIDLKTISTDHIQKIEIIKGVSSAKLGNLSSGVIQTTSKIGQTPLQLRVKTDPLNKLAYLGKGFRLAPTLGFIHAGVDYTSIHDDRRDPMSKYSRLTGQVTYNNSLKLAGRPLFLFLKLSETYTLNQAKEDELVKEYNESFRNKYSRTGAALKMKLSEVNRFVDNLELISSADYTYDLIDRNRLVQLEIPLPSPIATVEGENEGIFLPSRYYSPFQIENKPLALLNQLNAESLLETGSFRHKLIYGAEWKYTKNYGEGAIVDMSRPPYPENSEYVRPTPNNSIPALSTGAAYLEEQLTHSNRYFDLSLNAGVRATKMFNLSERYTELRKVFLEPRVNTAFSFNLPLKNGKSLRNMLRFGFGQENKMPTLDYIYPDKVYKDLIVLSAYIKHEDPNNHMITNTRIYDVTNYGLRPNRNTKLEAGWDVEYEGYLLSLVFFKEYSRQGFLSSPQYDPVSYKRYMEPVNGNAIIGKRPEKTDYVEETYNTFVNMSIVRNCMKVDKKGIEYRLKFPKIEPISTHIEVNGAYYETRYASDIPVEYHPEFKDDNKPMPYVGIYAKDDITRRRILNSNIWLNTNIPRYKMIFTTFFQIIWLNDNKRINGDEYPSSYFGHDGIIHPVDASITEAIKGGDLTWRHYHLYKEPYYEKEPISLTVNFKVTKEFNSMIKASFFVNNILDINPGYKNRYQQNVRNWKKSLFGAEMTFSF